MTSKFKIKNKKRFITICLVVGSIVLCAIFAICFLVPSYVSWKQYYDEVSQEWASANSASSSTSSIEETSTESKVNVGYSILTLEVNIVKEK